MTLRISREQTKILMSQMPDTCIAMCRLVLTGLPIFLEKIESTLKTMESLSPECGKINHLFECVILFHLKNRARDAQSVMTLFRFIWATAIRKEPLKDPTAAFEAAHTRRPINKPSKNALSAVERFHKNFITDGKASSLYPTLKEYEAIFGQVMYVSDLIVKKKKKAILQSKKDYMGSLTSNLLAQSVFADLSESIEFSQQTKKSLFSKETLGDLGYQLECEVWKEPNSEQVSPNGNQQSLEVAQQINLDAEVRHVLESDYSGDDDNDKPPIPKTQPIKEKPDPPTMDFENPPLYPLCQVAHH
jgi:hypothetical protein